MFQSKRKLEERLISLTQKSPQLWPAVLSRNSLLPHLYSQSLSSKLPLWKKLDSGPGAVYGDSIPRLFLLYNIVGYSKKSKRELFSFSFMYAAAKSLQSYATLCDPTDGSPPGSPIPGILQARILEWVAISFSNAWKWKVKGKSLSHIRLLATPWTTVYQAPPSMGFSRQEYWSELHV